MSSTQLTVAEAASKLSLTPQQVRNLCRDGKLKAHRLGRTWVIELTEVTYHYETSSCGVAEDREVYGNDIATDFKPIALSFFSGAMGLDIGLQQAGFRTLLASEIDNASRKTILRNHPEIALIGDIRNYNADSIRKAAGLSLNQDIDLMAGGPPCQAFSTAGNRKGFEDERGNVFLTYLDLILSLRPKFAVIENVRGLLSAPLSHRPHNLRGDGFEELKEIELEGGALRDIIVRLEEAGYGVSFNLYNSANFGTPQIRERVVLICSRNGKKAPYLVPTHSEDGVHGFPKWRTFGQAVNGLRNSDATHIQFPDKRLRYYRMLGPGQNWRNLPDDLQREAMGASYYSGGGKTGFLRRLDPARPAPTLVTHPAMPATDLAHPTEDRPLSIEEYKRIQEFPDDYRIEGSLIEQYRQIGNAVPVSLGRAVGTLIMHLLNGRPVPQYKGFKYSRYRNSSDRTWLHRQQELMLQDA
jgi:DNA (cytosine-5)-methyltransferase 1